MPTIAVDKAALFKELGREYTTKEFDELCFEFGIELDEDTSESTKPEDQAQPPQLKIEIPANRYDMLCFEGIALNLKVFLEKEQLPKWQVTPPKDGQLQELHIKPEVRSMRQGTLFCGQETDGYRRRKSESCALASSSAASSSHKHDTTRSLRCRTSCTRTSLASAPWSPSAHTISTRSRVPSHTRL
jgi:hypothetical protein